jgi:hypothetical protein
MDRILKSSKIVQAELAMTRGLPHLQRNFLLALAACSAYNICMQYTIRNVPVTLDEALRRTAREQDKSLNEVAIEALARGAGVTGERGRQRDLSDIAGTWRKDLAFERALAAQDTIDEEMWR